MQAIKAHASKYGFDEDTLNKGVRGMVTWASTGRDQNTPPSPGDLRAIAIWKDEDFEKTLRDNGVVEGRDAVVWRIYGQSTR